MTELVIKEDGTFHKRTIGEVQIELLPSIEQAFQANASFKLKSIVDFSDLGMPFFGQAAITACSAQPDVLYWSVRVKTLNLNTAFELKDGILTPDFANHGDVKKQMEIPWRMPDDMRLVLGVAVEGGENEWVLRKHYLVAYDKTGHTYRLPLANLYDHCELCHGQDTTAHPTAIKALRVALENFRKSVWNADLFYDFQKVNAPLMFRFKPVNTGFEQLPLEKPWTVLCQKISNELITSKLQPV